MSEHDFIVVGTGSAGTVIASRLSENSSTNVLSLEAGGTDMPANLSNPSKWFTLWGTQIDWAYKSVPQPGLNNRVTPEPRGKGPGGSNNLNAVIHIRGNQSDYNNWAYNGCPGWDYQSLLPFFQRLEHQEDNTSPWEGKEGALNVINTKLHNPNPTSAAFIEACRELGYPYTEDFNGPHMEGVGWHHADIKDGKRFSVVEGYLNTALERSNLTLSTNSMVTRLLFDGKRCIGVEYNQNGETKTAYAKREVIVSAGSIESPKLLLLSGIGNPTRLREFDIAVVAEVPGVGENFHNHTLAGVTARTKKEVPLGRLNNAESCLFCKSHPDWTVPDLQLAFTPVPFSIVEQQTDQNLISILPGITRPLSRGWVRLASKNPFDKPLINPNYFAVESDLERLVQGVKIARQIFTANAFSEWFEHETVPGPDTQTDEELRDFLRKSTLSYHHQVGSCKMGLDDMAVVDPQLRVHGIEGLRVADGSIMPCIPIGNIHTSVVMIGEKAADLLKKAHGL